MPNLKVYEWERERYGEYEKQSLHRAAQQEMLECLAKRFKIAAPNIAQSYRRGAGDGYGGSYNSAYRTVRMGKIAKLSTVVHEFAHHLNWMVNGKRGHRGSFRFCLTQSYAAMQDIQRKKTLAAL